MTFAPSPESPCERPDSVVWRVSLATAGGALGLLGILTLLAWACGEPDYLQLDAALPPLHYNGAIGFLVWAGAYFALATCRFRAARALAVVLGGFALLVFAASLPGSGVRLDRWALAPAASSPPVPRAGVAPGMGLGFALAALAVLLVARRAAGPTQALVVTLVGAFLAVGGPIVLASHSVVAVVRPSGPAVLGVVGAAVAGLALLTAAFRRRVPSFALGRTVPLGVGLAGLGLTFALTMALNAEQNRRLHRQVQFETAHVQRLAQDQLPERLNIAQFAERWTPKTADAVKADVGNFVGRQPGCLGVARIDAARGVSWIEWAQSQPEPKSLAAMGLTEPLDEALRTGTGAVVRPARSCWRGTRVLAVFAPRRPGAPDGGLVVVVRLQDLFDTIINTNAAAGYAVTVSDGDDPLFGRYGTDREHRELWAQTLPLSFRGNDWRLSVWPTQEILARENLSLPKLSMLIGLLGTALLALAVHLAQTARRRTAALEKEVREREQAERAMRQSEEKYRTLIENLGQGVFLQDREHRHVAANVQFCRGVGRTEAEIVGRTEVELYDSERAARHAEEVRTVLAEGRTVESEQEEVVAGKRTCVRRVLTPVRDAAGVTTGVLGICWDVTEQRQLEAHVHQASKMDAIGQLAGGIAHDFNNLLTVILGNLELILARFDDADPDRELAESARGAAVRAAALTQRLLGFSRRHQLDWRPTSLNAVATEVVGLLQRTIDPLIRIETHLVADLWPVQADPTQLNQVLMNLCLNARDAIKGAGQITVETACVGADEPRGRGAPNAPAGELVRLRVTDTGAGMTPEVKARIYEPFFTTKEVGKGTGLGLAMVFAIVRQHKGWIDCHSEPGRGTRFDVYLPRGEAAKPPPPAPVTVAPSRTGQGTILVVDDEALIRKLAATTLAERGYRVLLAADGRQALDVYSTEKDRIDLVVLDLTMPVLSGHEAFRRLLALNPRVRVLFASGYAVEQLSELEKELMAGFVKKPYRPDDLLHAVAEALQGRSTVSAPTPAPASPFRMPAVAAS